MQQQVQKSRDIAQIRYKHWRAQARIKAFV